MTLGACAEGKTGRQRVSPAGLRRKSRPRGLKEAQTAPETLATGRHRAGTRRLTALTQPEINGTLLTVGEL